MLITRVVRAALIAALFVPALGAAQALNDTASLRCVGEDGQWAPTCKGSGQDGAFGRDARQSTAPDGDAGFSFAKVCHSGAVAGTDGCRRGAALGSGPNDWACTLDRVTGLTWEIKTTDGGIRDMRHRFYFGRDGSERDAQLLVDQANGEQLCGHADWRVPSYLELMTLQHYGIAAPAPTIDPTFFPNTASDGVPYLSITLHDLDSTYRRFVNFTPGAADGANDARLNLTHARLVRGTPLTSIERFVASDDGLERSDSLGRIVWRVCPEGRVFEAPTCSGTPVSVDWATALALAHAAGPGWRLPNIAELTSLLGPFGGICSVLPGATAPTDAWWSNTPHVNGVGPEGGVWIYRFQSGVCGRGTAQPSELHQLRLVRRR